MKYIYTLVVTDKYLEHHLEKSQAFTAGMF